jgi:Trk-type K+ transport system membrane component
MQTSLGNTKRAGLTASQIVVFGFLVGNVIGTTLLSLPIASVKAGSTDLLTAAFTSVSSLSLSGFTVVNTATHWSTFGQVVILALIKIGGFGIMALGSLLGMVLTHRVSFKTKLTSTEETQALGLDDFGRLLIRVFQISAAIEITLTLLLTLQLHFTYKEDWGSALWHGFFHAISAFNNAGFTTYDDGLMRFVSDPLVLLLISTAVVIGGLGFPVIIELSRRVIRRLRLATFRAAELGLRMSLTAKITLSFSAALLALGTIFIGLVEWNNAETIGALGTTDKIVNAFVASVMSRNAGFNALDYSELTRESWLGTEVLMFIGGGSAGTSGGLRITTFAVLIYIVIAEIRGDERVNVGTRRLGVSVQRTAVSLAMLGIAVVLAGVIALELLTDLPTDKIVFEVVSAFGTCGLSTGITADLPDAGKVVLMILMFVGRIGLVLVATALAQRTKNLSYRLPKERPLIG